VRHDGFPCELCRALRSNEPGAPAHIQCTADAQADAVVYTDSVTRGSTDPDADSGTRARAVAPADALLDSGIIATAGARPDSGTEAGAEALAGATRPSPCLLIAGQGCH
jgi:hypothetical protein